MLRQNAYEKIFLSAAFSYSFFRSIQYNMGPSLCGNFAPFTAARGPGSEHATQVAGVQSLS